MLIWMSIAVVVFFVSLYYLLSSSPEKDTTAKVVEVVKASPVELVDVLVATQPIESGRLLEQSMFQRVPKPKLGLSPRVVKSFDDIRGTYARTLIVPDQPLHPDYITRVRPINEIVQQIPEGYRAVSIRVDQISSVEGWARPGAQVDVVWASAVNGKPAVTVVVENAKVLSAERVTQAEVKPGMPIPSTVTLLVSTEDSKKIQLATTAGALSLVLRGEQGGNSRGSTGGTITVDDLLAGKLADKNQQDCQGRLKMCNGDGRCETLCLRSDGSLVPLVSPTE